jgi:glycosyltransferase involved in cell wall biosynthesis
VYYEQHQLLLALQRASEFDVVHSHVGWGGYALSGALSRPPVLHTQHNPVYGDQEWFVFEHPDLWYSTVSQFQARKFERCGATRCHVIHNGIDVSRFTFQPHGSDGLLFVGRMEEEKGPDLAVQVARALGRPLTLAGPIIDEEFFDQAIPKRADPIRGCCRPQTKDRAVWRGGVCAHALARERRLPDREL